MPGVLMAQLQAANPRVPWMVSLSSRVSRKSAVLTGEVQGMLGHNNSTGNKHPEMLNDPKDFPLRYCQGPMVDVEQERPLLERDPGLAGILPARGPPPGP